MTIAILSSKGQVTIPLSIRQKLGLNKGDRIEFIELDNGQFSIVAATEDVRTLKGIVAKPTEPVSIEDMNRMIAKRGAGL
jgi:AbrB family looped-hinge helix DNA binding protein